MDIVCASSDKFGINGHRGIWSGLDIATNNGLQQIA